MVVSIVAPVTVAVPERSGGRALGPAPCVGPERMRHRGESPTLAASGRAPGGADPADGPGETEPPGEDAGGGDPHGTRPEEPPR